MRSLDACVSGALLVGSLLMGCQSPAGDLAQRSSPLAAAEATTGHPAVGIISFLSPGRLRFCTGTLVGHCWVLTAAHCVDDADTNVEGMRFRTVPTLTTQEAEENKTGIEVERFAINPTYSNTAEGRVGDAALIRLKDAQCPLTPPIPVARRAPEAGLPLTLIGYGATSYGNTDFGVKRVGTNQVDEVNGHEFTLRNQSGSDSLICSGDSGGPAFALLDGRQHQVGVHSRGVAGGGLADACSADGTHYEARVDQNLQWLLAESNSEVLAESDVDESVPTVAIERPLEGEAVAVSPDVFDVVVRAEDDTRVQYVDIYVRGVHIERLKSAPYRLDGLTVDTSPTVLVEAVAMDATGKEARASITVRAVGEVVDMTTPGTDSSRGNPSLSEPAGSVDTLTGSSGCNSTAEAPRAHHDVWLYLVFALALAFRSRCRAQA